MAASLMQVPPSGPGNLCEPRLSFQFRIASKASMVAIPVAHPHTRSVDVPTSLCQRPEASLEEVYPMSDKNEQSDEGLDDFDKASRLNFRDYPSTSLVMIAALSSGLGWVLYKWLGRKRAGQRAGSGDSGETEGN